MFESSVSVSVFFSRSHASFGSNDVLNYLTTLMMTMSRWYSNDDNNDEGNYIDKNDDGNDDDHGCNLTLT